MNSPSALRFQWISRLVDVPQEVWDSLLGPDDSPVLSWLWLNHFETSLSASPETGWRPQHLLVWGGRDLIAAANFYLKSHSTGEFVYDHVWADAARQLRTPYYPKLVGMSPFTPASGWQFLASPRLSSEGRGEIYGKILAEALTQAQKLGARSLQLNYVGQALSSYLRTHESQAGSRASWAPWNQTSFLWSGRHYQTFQDFLGGFDKNQRKNIRKERESVQALGIRFVMMKAADLEREWLPLLWDFYEATNDQFGPWSCKFLTREWFLTLQDRPNPDLLFLLAFEPGESVPLAMALFLTRGTHLIGRYWGARKPVKNLHFCTCYYEPLQWAIEHGLKTFDPGAGSPHKIRRGFQAEASTSWHYFFDPVLHELFCRYVPRFNQQEALVREELNQESPLKISDRDETEEFPLGPVSPESENNP